MKPGNDGTEVGTGDVLKAKTVPAALGVNERGVDLDDVIVVEAAQRLALLVAQRGLLRDLEGDVTIQPCLRGEEDPSKRTAPQLLVQGELPHQHADRRLDSGLASRSRFGGDGPSRCRMFHVASRLVIHGNVDVGGVREW